MCLTFKKCCCCISLEVGAQVISVVSTMVSAAMMLVYGAAATVLRLPDSRTTFYGSMAVLAGCQCLLGVLLAYGVFMKSPRPRLLWPWSVFCWCKSAALLALCVLGTAALACGAGGGGGYHAPDTSAVISFYIVYSVVLFYCACVVNSRRLQLLREPYPDYLPTLALSASAYPYPLKP